MVPFDEDWRKSTCPNKNGLVHVLGEAAKFDSQVDISGVNYIAGWWYTYPLEKYESQIGSSSKLLGKIKFMFQTTNQWLLTIINHD